jgi:hypothetical protein
MPLLEYKFHFYFLSSIIQHYRSKQNLLLFTTKGKYKAFSIINNSFQLVSIYTVTLYVLKITHSCQHGFTTATTRNLAKNLECGSKHQVDSFNLTLVLLQKFNVLGLSVVCTNWYRIT